MRPRNRVIVAPVSHKGSYTIEGRLRDSYYRQGKRTKLKDHPETAPGKLAMLKKGYTLKQSIVYPLRIYILKLISKKMIDDYHMLIMFYLWTYGCLVLYLKMWTSVSVEYVPIGLNTQGITMRNGYGEKFIHCADPDTNPSYDEFHVIQVEEASVSLSY